MKVVSKYTGLTFNEKCKYIRVEEIVLLEYDAVSMYKQIPKCRGKAVS